jgi:hypothetical protein
MKHRRHLDIADRMRGKPHLVVQESSLFHIPERLAEYDSDLFVVRNKKNHRYEIHSLANRGNTHCITVPHEELDARAIEMFAKFDQRKRSFKSIMLEIDRHNEAKKMREERHRRSEINAMAREIRPAVKRLAEEVY